MLGRGLVFPPDRGQEGSEMLRGFPRSHSKEMAELGLEACLFGAKLVLVLASLFPRAGLHPPAGPGAGLADRRTMGGARGSGSSTFVSDQLWMDAEDTALQSSSTLSKHFPNNRPYPQRRARRCGFRRRSREERAEAGNLMKENCSFSALGFERVCFLRLPGHSNCLYKK